MMNSSDIRIGDVLDLKIQQAPNPTYIVGEVVGIRSDWGGPDEIAIKIAGVDWWISLDDKIEVSPIG
jgi:hypothetical protein